MDFEAFSWASLFKLRVLLLGHLYLDGSWEALSLRGTILSVLEDVLFLFEGRFWLLLLDCVVFDFGVFRMGLTRLDKFVCFIGLDFRLLLIFG